MTATVTVEILADAKKAQKALADTGSDLGELGSAAQRTSSDMAKAFDGVDATSARKAITGTGKDLAQLDSDTRETAKGFKFFIDAADDAGSKLKDFGTIAGGVFTGEALAEGASSLGEKFTAAFSDAMDIEVGTDRLAAQLGLSAEASAHYGELAGDLYAGAYGESLDQVNDALRFVNQNIGELVGDNDDAFKNATASVLDFTAAFGEDLGPTTRAVGQMIKTGLAKDAAEALDLLTVGMQQGLNSSDDLLDTFNEYPAAFQALGLDGKIAMGLIKQGLAAGAKDADKVADVIKEFGIRAKDASKSTGDAFAALGLDAQKMTKIFAKGGPDAAAGLDQILDKLRTMEDPVARNTASVGLFGAQYEDLQGVLSSLDPSAAAAALGEVGGAAATMGATLADNAGTKLEAFKRGMSQGLTDFITTTVLPKVVEFGEKVAEVFEKIKGAARLFASAFKGEDVSGFDLGPLTQPIIDFAQAARELSDEWLPKLQEAFKTLGDTASTAFEWAKTNQDVLITLGIILGIGLVAAVYALASAMVSLALSVLAALWPFLLIGAAIFGLVAGIRWAYENWQPFRDTVDATFSWLKANVPPILETVRQGFETAFNWLKENVPPIVETVRGALEGAFKWIAETAIPAIKAAFESFLGFLDSTLFPALRNIATVVGFAVGLIVTIVRPIIDFLIGFFQDNFGHIVEVLTIVWDVIRNVISNAWQVISNVIQFFLNIIALNWGGAWDNIKNIFSAVWDTIQNIASSVFGILRETIQFFLSLVGSLAGRLLEGLKNLAGLALGFLADIWHGITDTFGKVFEFIGGVGGKIADLARGMWDGIWQAFKGVINLIIRGWNALKFEIPGFDLGPIHFGGFTLGLPTIPQLAAGGIVTRPLLSLVGEAGPEAVIPLSRLGTTIGGDTHLHVVVNHTGLGVDSPRLQRDIVGAIRQYTAREGPITGGR